ncbi:unnamed protein product, partial [Urochloa humidicola]
AIGAAAYPPVTARASTDASSPPDSRVFFFLLPGRYRVWPSPQRGSGARHDLAFGRVIRPNSDPRLQGLRPNSHAPQRRPPPAAAAASPPHASTGSAPDRTPLMRAAAAASPQLVARAALLLSPRLHPPIPRPHSIMNPSSSSSPPGGYHSRSALASQQPRGDRGRRGGRGGGGGRWERRGRGDGGDRIDALGSSSSSSSGGYHSMAAAAASPQPRGGGGGRRGGRGSRGGWGGLGAGGGNGSDRVDALGSLSSSPSGGYHSMAADFPSLQTRGGGGRGGNGGGNRSDGIDALGSSSSTSSADYHSMTEAFGSLQLRDGGGGGGRGGRGGGNGSERVGALGSSSPPPSSGGYHSSAGPLASLQPRGGGGRGRGIGGGGDGRRIAALGRILSKVLRHMAEELGLNMRPDGYVRVSDLLKLNLRTYADVPLKSHTVDEIREAVRRDNKQRFGLLEEDGELLIRANQGHTITTVTSESLLKPILSADEVSVCVHGTFRKKLDSILQSGLSRMTRLHVHFSNGLPSDGQVISGMRKNVNILIHLDVRKALNDGMKLYISDNNVILTEGFDGFVPVKYFEKIETWPGRAPIPFQR